METGHCPIRTCIGCRRTADQNTLLRLACVETGRLAFTGKRRSGRGAYLCPDIECMEHAVKRRAFDRAFRRRVVSEPPGRLYAMAVEAVEKHIQRLGTEARTTPGGTTLQGLLDSLAASSQKSAGADKPTEKRLE